MLVADARINPSCRSPSSRSLSCACSFSLSLSLSLSLCLSGARSFSPSLVLILSLDLSLCLFHSSLPSLLVHSLPLLHISRLIQVRSKHAHTEQGKMGMWGDGEGVGDGRSLLSQLHWRLFRNISRPPRQHSLVAYW